MKDNMIKLKRETLCHDLMRPGTFTDAVEFISVGHLLLGMKHTRKSSLFPH